jgi:hypothetical protein
MDDAVARELVRLRQIVGDATYQRLFTQTWTNFAATHQHPSSGEPEFLQALCGTLTGYLQRIH